ncbi:MAG: SufD family Fe-S cluster assembly protein [Bacilli bacterium]
MNRIVVDRNIKSNNLKATITNNKLSIIINNDCDILINNNDINEIEIVVKKGEVNILRKTTLMVKMVINIKVYDACVSVNNIIFDGKDEDINVSLLGKNSKIKLNNSIITNSEKMVKVNIDHLNNNSKSVVYNCGATFNDGSIDFDITTKVKKGVKGCFVDQDSKIICLSNHEKNIIKPVLLIDEYDVNARHAAFIGKFNKEQVFYLQTRGIAIKDAYNLLLNGFLTTSLDISSLEKEGLKEKTLNYWR